MELITPIVFCADENYGAYLPAAIQSIINISSSAHHYHIIILDCGMSEEMIDVLARQIRPVANFSLHVKNIETWLIEHKKSFVETGYLTKAMYGRLLIPEVCAAYEKVIYADIDMIFNRDIAELFAFDLGENYVAAVPDLLTEAERIINPQEGKFICKTLKLDNEDHYVCSGFLIFNIQAWNDNKLAEKCIAFLQNNKTRFPDQDAINAVCRGKTAYLSQEWCCTVLVVA